MHVWVQRQLLPPGVQGHDHSRLGTQVPRVGGQLEQRVARGGEQQIPEQDVVAQPQGVELVGHGEDDVMVRAAE